jgi:hypothetical protein
MNWLEFAAIIGAKTQVMITQPQGAFTSYQVLIDQWLQNTLVKRDKERAARPNRKSILANADIGSLGELIDAANRLKGPSKLRNAADLIRIKLLHNI